MRVKKQKLIIFLVGMWATINCYASLQQLIDDGLLNELEESAAIAADATYNRLINQGCIDPIDDGGGECSGSSSLFTNVRELVHTANEISGGGPTAYSLGADIEGLGFALRWNTAEEYAAQGDLSDGFADGQVSRLATRLIALRLGATGFKVNGLASNRGESYDPNAFDHQEIDYFPPAPKPYKSRFLSGKLAVIHQSLLAESELYLNDNNPGLDKKLSFSGDSENSGTFSESYSRWGGFANFDFGFGSREDTVLEDAFDFESAQITVGFDYRVNDQWVVGVVSGLSQQTVDFDSTKSIVEGEIEADGYSLMPFAMYQKGNWFFSSSFGVQRMAFDSERAIRYPSFNLDTPSGDTLTVSSTDADILSAFFEAGYTFQKRKWTIEPYLNLKYSDIRIDGFTERDIKNEGFDLAVQGQDITSQEVTLGAKLQYTFTPSFTAVLIPYYILEMVNQTDDTPRVIEAYYAQDATGDVAFKVPTESVDGDYSIHTLGVFSVIRGGRQGKFGGPVGGEIQGFFNYRTFVGLEHFDIDLFSLGLRYTF
ncbi:MAG: hypothetical protein ACI82Z_001997 [Cellvibrionaceae bacterium]|jgi:uncharacterized protein YhjY with autotransporter beta-barrel domain